MANYDQRKSELIAELDRARSRARLHREQIQGNKGRAAAKAEATISRNRYGWMLGALIVGFIITQLPARTKKVAVDRKGKRVTDPNLANAKKAGIGLAVLKIALDAAKPVLMAWLTKRLGEAVHGGMQSQRHAGKADRRF